MRVFLLFQRLPAFRPERNELAGIFSTANKAKARIRWLRERPEARIFKPIFEIESYEVDK